MAASLGSEPNAVILASGFGFESLQKAGCGVIQAAGSLVLSGLGASD